MLAREHNVQQETDNKPVGQEINPRLNLFLCLPALRNLEGWVSGGSLNHCMGR
jgi:hypothetical protein